MKYNVVESAIRNKNNLIIALGIGNILASFAYIYPRYLTTPNLRAVYSSHFLQDLLLISIGGTLILYLISLFKKNPSKRALLGASFSTIALMVGGHRIPVGSVQASNFFISIDWLILAFIISFLGFGALEKFTPLKIQSFYRKNWKLDTVYFVFNHLIIILPITIINFYIERSEAITPNLIRSFVRDLPSVIQFVVAILIVDLVFYIEHRILHNQKFLWRIHAIHHSPKSMDWLASSRLHFVEMLLERTTTIIALYLVGISPNIISAYIVFGAIHAIVIHCNIGLNFKWIEWILISPRFHHWHHSSDPRVRDKNHGAHTIIFDKLFGTYFLPENEWPTEYGTREEIPSNFFKQFFYPLKKSNY